MARIRRIFLPAPQETESFGIQGVGVRESIIPKIVDRPNGFLGYLFMFFYDQVEIFIHPSTRAVPPFHLMIWRPGDRHYYGNRKTTWCHSWILCSGPLVADELLRTGMPLGEPIAIADSPGMERFFSDVYNELIRGDVDMVILRNLFQVWLRQISRSVGIKEKGVRIPDKLLSIKSYLEDNYHQHISLADLSRKFFVSIPHLESEYKRYFGTSVTNFMIGERLKHALYLLHDHDFYIKEIAALVGYGDIYYFSRLFKSRYGVSPNKIRQLYRSNPE